VFLAVASALALLRSRARYTFFGALWLAFSAMGVAMGGWWREHYFIQLVPALAFLASVGLSSLRGGPLRGLWIIALGLAALLFVRRDAALAFEAPRAISWHLYHRPGYLVAEPIARYIGEHTREDETIYVAFAEAEIYYLAGRRAAVPQFYYLHAQYSRRLFESIVDAIRSRTPALVVLVNDPPPNMMSRTTFLEILNANYVPRRDFRAFENFPAVTVFHRRAAGAD
jgi:hypothetical protein